MKGQSLRIASHSLANGSTSRDTSKNIGQPRVPLLSANRTYKSNASSLFSSVDWSSSPRPSTPNTLARSNKRAVPSGKGPAVDYKTRTLKPLNNSKDASVVQDELKPDKQGSAVRSASMTKPTGLLVPSPKVGYFDGARTGVARTPTSLATGLAKHATHSPNGATRTKRSPLIQESTNSKAKATPVSRVMIVSASASSPKLTNKMYSKVSAEEQLNGHGEEHNLTQ